MAVATQNLRKLILLVTLLVLSAGVYTGAQAQDTGQPPFTIEGRTYLYYFETDDALLTGDARLKGYAFGTHKREKVTILVYGLDNLVTPKLTVYDQTGRVFSEGTAPFNQNIQLVQFTAQENTIYYFDVERVDSTDSDGIARVMLFSGDPINQDITILDDINPLLPGRGFLVAGEAPSTKWKNGLPVEVRVLDVNRFDTKPQVFASRGTFRETPPLNERLEASEEFHWFNADGSETYTISVRALPEETTEATKNADYRALNLNTFFYFDYYLTIGSGSEPVQLVRGDDCQTSPDRVECIRVSGSDNGRTAPSPIESLPQVTPPAAEDGGTSILSAVVPSGPPPPPPLTACTGGGTTGITFNGVGLNNDTVGGTPCSDTLNGNGGNDVLAGGPGDDLITGGIGVDTLYGGDDNDEVDGGDGNDFVFGEGGNDLLTGGNGNDEMDGGTGSDFILYDTATGAVTVDLSTPCAAPAGFTGCATGAAGTDHISNAENIVGSNFDDTLTGNHDPNNIQGRAGDDTMDGGLGDDVLYGEEGNDTLDGGDGNDLISAGNGNDNLNPGTGANNLFGGLGNDTFTFDQAQTGLTTVDGGNSSAGDSDTYLFQEGVSGSFQIRDWFGGSNDVINFSGMTTTGVNFSLGNANFTQMVTSFLNIYLVDDDIGGLIGTNQNDVLGGSNFFTPDDVIDARGGDDRVVGSRGTDAMNGGAGNDTIDYSNDQGGAVVVDLTTGVTSKAGTGTNDALSGFENIIGSSSDDTLIGDNNANIIDGRNGTDVMTANGGNDTIIASNGNDTINGGTGTDLYDASGLTTGTFINLQGGTASFTGSNQTLTGIESVIGTAFNDTVYAATTTTSVSTGAGRDFIVSTDGTHTYDGGSEPPYVADPVFSTGGDTLYYALEDVATVTTQGAITVNLNGSAGTVTGSGVNDTFSNIENIIGTVNNDIFNINDGIGPAAGAPPTTTEPYSYLTGLTGSDRFVFNAAATGYVRLGNDNTDILIRSANFDVGFSTAVTNQWQVAIPGQLYVWLDQPISAACDGTTPLNLPYTTGDDDQTVMRDTNCRTDDTFDGLAGNDTINYAVVPGLTRAIATLTGQSVVTFTVTDGLPAGTGPIGTDQVRNTENILLGTGNDILYVQTIALTGHVIDFGTGTNSVSFIGYAPGITVNLDTGGSNLTFVANQITSVEGSLAADNITGNNLNNTFVVQADADADVLNAGAGGADVLRYATTTDFTTYTPVANALTVNLDVADTVDDGLGVDTIVGFDGIFTGTGADTFNLNEAGGAYTLLDAGGGDDTFQGVTTFGGSTWNGLQGGTGTDTLSFTTDGSLFAMTVNGGTVNATSAVFGTTIFNTTGVEQVVGSNTANIVNIQNTTGLTEVNGAGGNDLFMLNAAYAPTAATVLDADNGVLNGTTDTLDMSLLPGAVVVNVTAGNTAAIAGGNPLRDFENFYGTTLNDTFNVTFDDTVTHRFDGWAGAQDTLNYATSAAGLVVNVDNPDTTVDNAVAGGFTDTVTNFENFVGSAQNDTFNIVDASQFTGATGVSGGAGDDTFNLAALDAGNNRYDGGTQTTADSINYNVATDLTLNVNAAGTTVTVQDTAATAGLDTLVGFESIVSGTGNDTWRLAGTPTATYDANAGTDTADFSVMGSGVTVNLNLAPPTVVGAGGTTTLINFENIISTNFADTWNVTVSAGRTLDALGGVDTIAYLTAGAATFAGAGVTAGGAADTLNNFETMALNNNANTVTVDVAGYTGSLSTLNTLDNADNMTINGSTGVLVNINSGNDNDTWSVTAVDTTANIFDGGAGTDSITYNAGAAVPLTVTVNSATSTTVFDGTTTDTLNNFETILSGAAADSWTVNALFNATFDAQGGNDTITYTDATGDLVIDLRPGNPTVTGAGGTSTLMSFQNINSNNGNDTWIMNTSTGRTLNGNGGVNTASYTTTGAAALTGANVTAGGSVTADVLNNIQTVSLSAGVDPVTINGYTGSIATLNTLGGNDTITISGSTGALVNVNSGANNDTWTVSNFDATNNIFDGDASTDSITYNVATALTVAVNSATSTTIANGGVTDTLNNFETMVSGSVSDTWTVSAMTTATYNGGAGTDTLTYAAAAGNLTFNFTGANPTVGDGTNTNTLLNFETIVSNNGNDTWIFDDTLNRTIDGQGGVNTVQYVSSGGNNFDIVLGATTTVTDGAGPDTLNNIQVIQLDNTIAQTDTLTISTPATVVTTVDLGLGVDTVTITSAVGTATNINSGGGNDTWAVNTVTGGATFDGGANTDTLTYVGATADLTLDLTAAAWTVTAVAGTDTLNNFEALTASGSGNDTWTVNTPSGQTYNAGTGTDTMIYATTTGAVGLAGASFGPGAGNDTLTGFETLTLNNNVNTLNVTAVTPITTLNTLGGNDVVTISAGFVGPTTINLGDNNDSLTNNGFDTASSTYDGGNGTDTYAYTGGTGVTLTWVSAVQATLTDGTPPPTDTLNNFENFTTGSGNDTFNWRADGVTNTLNGGTGNNTLDFTGDATALAFSVGATDTVTGGGATDTLVNFAVLRGGDNSDTFTITDSTGYTSMVGGLGDDTFTVAANGLAAATAITAGAGDDAFILLPDNNNNSYNGDTGTNNSASYAGYTGGTALTVALNAAVTVSGGGGAGTDTLNNIQTMTTSGAVDNVTVNAPTTVSTLNTGDGNDTVGIATNAGTLTAVNTDNGNDTVTIGAADAQTTTFDGGAGTDQYLYTTGNADATVGLDGTDTVQVGGVTDTFNNFEGTTLAPNTITTGTGNDIFTIDITNPDSYLLAAGSGANMFVFIGDITATTGGSVQVGGSGTETLDFSGVTGGGVTVDLNNITTGQAIGTFTLRLTTTIDNVIGTPAADTITGDVNNNVISGNAGNDTINAGGGADTVYGGDGADTMTGGAGNDTLYGGNNCGLLGTTVVAAQADTGNDNVEGNDGNDTVFGGNNNTGAVNTCNDTGSDTVTDVADTANDTDNLNGGNNNGATGTGTDTGTDLVNSNDGDALDTAFGDNEGTGSPAVAGDTVTTDATAPENTAANSGDGNG